MNHSEKLISITAFGVDNPVITVDSEPWVTIYRDRLDIIGYENYSIDYNPNRSTEILNIVSKYIQRCSDKAELVHQVTSIRKEIINQYHNYLNKDIVVDSEGCILTEVLGDIYRLNKLETKPLEAKFMKFNEEFGEMTAEALKYLGHTYKEYDSEHLKEEMADALQCLFSLYIDLGERTGINIIDDILPEILVKNKKWESKIKEYRKK